MFLRGCKFTLFELILNFFTMLSNETFIEAFKEELKKRNYIYIAPMNKRGSWAEIFYVFSQIDEELRVAKVYIDPVDTSNKAIYERDAQKLVQYEHDNIVKVYDKGIVGCEKKEYFFLILEHIKGKNLEEIGGSLFIDRPVKDRVQFFIQFLNGIAIYRDDFEIHNDLHFGNVLISEESKIKEKKIKIIDPGSSKYTYKSDVEDYDLYLIKRQFLDFFFRPEELNQIGGTEDLGKLSFYDLKELFGTELQKAQEVVSNEEILEKCLNSLENIINFYFKNIDESSKNPLGDIPKKRQRKILADIQYLNIYKDIANSMGITVSGNWNPESHSRGKDHEIYITIRNLVIKIIQHEFGEARRITINLDGNLVLDHGLIEEELETIAIYKKNKKVELLLNYKESIHKDHPFDEIKVEYMDKSYYKYIENRNWKDASDQILHKIKRETQKINEMIMRLASIDLFLNLTEMLEAGLIDERFLPKNIYMISAKEIANKFNRDLPQYKNNLISEIDNQIKNLVFISANCFSLFSSSGIFIFLTDTQIALPEQLNNYFNKFNLDFLKKYINIDTNSSPESIKINEVEETFKNLYGLLDKTKISGLVDFLNEILKKLNEVQRVLS